MPANQCRNQCPPENQVEVRELPICRRWVYRCYKCWSTFLI